MEIRINHKPDRDEMNLYLELLFKLNVPAKIICNGPFINDTILESRYLDELHNMEELLTYYIKFSSWKFDSKPFTLSDFKGPKHLVCELIRWESLEFSCISKDLPLEHIQSLFNLPISELMIMDQFENDYSEFHQDGKIDLIINLNSEILTYKSSSKLKLENVDTELYKFAFYECSNGGHVLKYYKFNIEGSVKGLIADELGSEVLKYGPKIQE